VPFGLRSATASTLRSVRYIMARVMRLAAALVVLTATGVARADDPSPPPPPPSWAADRAPVPDLATKVEGGFPDALPLLGYDSNTGVGLGAGGHYTLTGSRSDPLFAYTPYRHRFAGWAYLTTGGYQQYILAYDGYYVGDSPYLVRAVLTYEQNTAANYFGAGTSTLADLSYQGHSYSTYGDAKQAAGPNYYHFTYKRPQGQVLLERAFLGGRLRALYGVNVQYESVATNGPTTKLGADCAAGLVSGCDGGWNNTLRAGFAYDTRDFAPDPNSGIFVDSIGQWSAKGFGSYANYVRLTTAARVYVSPFPELTDLVLAGRLLYSIQSAAVPFFSMNTLAMAGGTDDFTDQTGLGGERTLRGYKQDRFIGLVDATASAEVRWTFAKFPLLHQHFSVQIAPFIDTGRVFDRVGLSLDDWKVDGGAGLRIGWNRSTIIMFDYGRSSEDDGFYVDFGMPF
jgi:outer membrane protein assembly factor BamA